MSKEQTNPNLCYGQGILIKGYNNPDQPEGVLTAKGFADIRALYETYDDVLYFKNYRNSIFQILPASSFDINDQLKYIISNNLTTTQSNLEMLKAKAASEKNQFQLNVENKHKSFVCFGDEVVFKHIDSGTYLSGTICPSDGTSGAFLVQVTKDLKSSLIFKLGAYRSFESQSSPIPLQSPLVIENLQNKGFLTFEKTGITPKDSKNVYWNKSSIKSDESYRIPIKTESNSSQIYDCVTHFTDLSRENADCTMPWKFQLHFNDPDNDQLIQHDIVFFQHTQNCGVLAAIGEEQIALKELKGEKTSELCFFDCLWEIEEHKQVENSENAYILRHLMSGMTLGVEVTNSANEKKLRPKLIDITDGKGDGALDSLGIIELKKAKKEGGIIESGSYVNICSGDEMVLDIKKEKKVGNRETEIDGADLNENIREKKIIDPEKMAKMAANQFNYQIKKLQFTMDVSQHCFIIKEIDDSLKSEVLFALSFHSRLIKLREDLKWGAVKSEEKVTYLRLMQITSKVKEIKYFLKNTTIDDPNKEFKRPIEKKQIICYHLGISQLLFEVLYFMKKNLKGQSGEVEGKEEKPYKIFENKHNQKEKFMELYNAIYEVIFELIRDNYQFKVHVSKWFMFILDDVEVYGDEFMLNTLLQLLKNNIFFVNNFVTDELVEHLVQMMPNKEILADKEMTKVFHERKYIEIFRAFCICGKEVFSDNQILILNKFLKRLTDSQYENYDIKIVKKKDKDGMYAILCEAAVDKQTRKERKFLDYHKICEDQYKSAWSYLISFLNLIADMVQGRNKTVEGYVETLLTAEALSDLMINENLHEAEAPLIRIMHYLYAESPVFYPIDQVTRLITWESLDEETQLNSTKSRSQPSDSFLQVLTCIINKLKSYKPIRMQEQAKNEKLLVILDFVRETFQLGFWKDRKGVIEIFECLKTLLTPPQDINYTLIKQQSQKKEVILMINCKEKCLQILDHIINLDIDYNVNYFSKAFKNFRIPSKKIEVQISNFLEVSAECHFAVDFYRSFKELTKEFSNIVETGICKKMIELSKHGHPRLTSYSLRVLERILDMDSKASFNFSNLIFISGQDRKNLYEYIGLRRDKFFTLEYQNTTKINMNNQKSHYHMVCKEDDNSEDAGIMQDMYMISELIKNQNHLERIGDVKSLDASRTYKDLASVRLINFTNQRRSSNIMKQQILDASNIHQKVLTYILNCREIPSEELAKKLLHLCYKFMVSIIENNQSVKLTLMQYIPRIKHHIKSNVGCVDFLKEMYDNNKNMLFNETEILDLIKLICRAIEQEQFSLSFYKSKLLDFFRYLIYCNGRALKWNQIQILKIMQDDEYHGILIFEKSRITPLVKSFEQKNFASENEEDVIKSITMEPQLVYFTTLFQIMVSLIDGKCEVNMGKLIKKYPFKDLVQMLKEAERCWPLKRNIRAFLNRLYYFEPQIQTYMGTIIGEEINNIIKDLNHFIEIKSSANNEDYEKRTFENPVRFSYIESYLYLNLEENLFTLHQLVRKPQILEQLKNHLHSKKNMNSKEAPYQFIRICERLGWIRNYFSSKKNIFTTSFIKYLLKHLKEIISEFDDNIYADGMLFNGERMPSKSQKDRERKVVIQRILQGEITSFYVQKSPDIDRQKPLVYLLPPKVIMPPDQKNPNKQRLIRKLREILTRTVVEFKSKDDEIRYNQEKIISALQLSVEVKEEFMNSYNEKLHEIQNDHESFMKYIESIIIINNEDPKAFPSDLKLFFLKMIIGRIEQANKTEMPEKKAIDNWQPEDWEPSRANIEGVQIQLKKCGLQSFIATLLKDKIEENIELANEILLCGIAFLLGGNQATQKTLVEQIMADPDNRVFKNLQTLISKLGKLILKNIDESNFKPTDSQDFQITIIDNYDFYDQDEKYCHRKNVIEPSTTNQIIYHRDCITTYRRAFRFLQLLCENNNIANKNFIRDQGKNADVVDFITTATNELRNLFSVMCRSIQEVPPFLLDFLIQVTQIPVKKNQEALTNSSFFEDVCQMNSQFQKPGKLAMRNFEEDSSPLDDILNKTIQIILSMFQGNNKKTFQTVDTKIQPKFLTTILENKFKSLNISTKNDLLFYIKDSLQADENGESEQNLGSYKDEMKSILDIFIIFKKLKDRLGEENSRIYKSYRTMIKKTDGKENQFAEICEFLESCLISIEVVDSAGVIQTVYFPKHPCYYSLSATTKDYIMGEVPRGSHRDKIVGLFSYIISLKDNLQYSYKIKKTDGITEKDMQNNYSIAATMSIIICIYLMVFYHVIIEFGEAEFRSNRIIKSGCFFLSLVQLSFSIIYLYYWYRLRVWLKPEVISNDTDTSVGTMNNPEKETEESNSMLQKVFAIITYIVPKSLLQSPSKDQTFYNNGQFYRILIFVLVSFAGTFINPIVFYIHIIDIFCQAEMLASIFQAIALNVKSLMYISLLGAVFVGIFCTITFSNYMKNLYEEESPEMCHDMVSCILALYISGAIGQMEEFELTRFFYDLIYSTFFGILFSNIVSGIMLDSFASLREKTQELETDKSDFCYICNVSRERLEKKGLKFHEHTRKKHYLWNYVFYLISLRNKSSTDYTGLEYEINTQYRQKDQNMKIDWVPQDEETDVDYGKYIQEMKQLTDNFQSMVQEKQKGLQQKLEQLKETLEI